MQSTLDLERGNELRYIGEALIKSNPCLEGAYRQPNVPADLRQALKNHQQYPMTKLALFVVGICLLGVLFNLPQLKRLKKFSYDADFCNGSSPFDSYQEWDCVNGQAVLKHSVSPPQEELDSIFCLSFLVCLLSGVATAILVPQSFRREHSLFKQNLNRQACSEWMTPWINKVQELDSLFAEIMRNGGEQILLEKKLAAKDGDQIIPLFYCKINCHLMRKPPLLIKVVTQQGHDFEIQDRDAFETFSKQHSNKTACSFLTLRKIDEEYLAKNKMLPDWNKAYKMDNLLEKYKSLTKEYVNYIYALAVELPKIAESLTLVSKKLV